MAVADWDNMRRRGVILLAIYLALVAQVTAGSLKRTETSWVWHRLDLTAVIVLHIYTFGIALLLGFAAISIPANARVRATLAAPAALASISLVCEAFLAPTLHLWAFPLAAFDAIVAAALWKSAMRNYYDQTAATLLLLFGTARYLETPTASHYRYLFLFAAAAAVTWVSALKKRYTRQ